MKAIKNVKIISNNQYLEHKAVLYDNEIIDIVDETKVKDFNISEIIDGNNMYLSPGFIDVHIHGCSSFDTMDDDNENLDKISQNLTRTGVTSFLPTTMTMNFNQIKIALTKIAKCMNSSRGAHILGANMEGPFINKLFKGAHDENYIIPSDKNLIEEFKDIIKIITIAPETYGSMDLIDYCVKNGIVASIGHTAADFNTAMDAIKHGANNFTHTFNAMTPLKHREPGVVGAAMLSDVNCELIADNIHVHPSVQKLLVKIKGSDRIILITDSMRACLMCNGTYNLGGQDVIVNNGEARLIDGTLAGSVLTLNKALKHIVENTGLPIWEAIKMVTVNQAKLLRIDNKKGIIAKNYDADFTIFDDEYNIHYTIVDGCLVYKN